MIKDCHWVFGVSRKTRSSHFKRDARGFCFETLFDFCPVTGGEFYLKRIFLEKSITGRRRPSNCFCSECGIFLYKDKKRTKRGSQVLFGKG